MTKRLENGSIDARPKTPKIKCCSDQAERGTYTGDRGQDVVFCRKCGRTGHNVTRHPITHNSAEDVRDEDVAEMIEADNRESDQLRIKLGLAEYQRDTLVDKVEELEDHIGYLEDDETAEDELKKLTVALMVAEAEQKETTQ